ncbi:cell division protein [Aquaspirillum sp. LM1]|uniref:peptidoglycan D,D-transpeptidase FtsI family protein n=1 Tax=Aquaspirillum sp. LM1 TaxID=1938604 RepID=UPI0009838F41|nr:penicillin-binding protein 2 [Aquaspirillum sp. LM1]AQR66038.1 cell division protein [Aquaspirillum sp. LM1]
MAIVGATRHAPRPSPSVRLPPVRMRWVGLGLGLLFVALLGRAVYLQLVKQDFLQSQGAARYSRAIELEANRGVIADRNGEPLAISTPVQSIWASPADMEPVPADKINQLARLLEMDPAEVSRKLSDKRREFLYIKRQISPDLADAVMKLGIPGIAKQQEFRRFYPDGEMTAHVVGVTGVDGRGQEGLELAKEKMLAGKPGRRHVIKDRRGHIIEDIAAIERPRDGQTLSLSIDRKIQYLAFRELKAAVETFKAKAGGVVVLDAHTGEVLALANLPSFNPNNRQRLDPAMKRNRALTDLFEPGSTLKPFTVAKALDDGVVRTEQMFNTESYSIGPARIKDSHSHPQLAVWEIIQKSSNVGSSKIALMLPPQTLWQLFDDVGFGRVPQTGFPGEATGRVRPYKTWKPIEQATMSYGHGISLSLMQLARAYTIFTNDGVLMPVSFFRLDQAMPGKPVLKPDTARKMRDMLMTVTQPGGTAPRAQVLGFNVGGKTGTAHKQEGRGYAASKYISSFVGFAPATRPRLIVAVMIDEPQGQYYGGTVAGPVFSNVMAGSLRILGVEPDAPTNNTLIPLDNIPEVREET